MVGKNAAPYSLERRQLQKQNFYCRCCYIVRFFSTQKIATPAPFRVRTKCRVVVVHVRRWAGKEVLDSGERSASQYYRSSGGGNSVLSPPTVLTSTTAYIPLFCQPSPVAAAPQRQLYHVVKRKGSEAP